MKSLKLSFLLSAVLIFLFTAVSIDHLQAQAEGGPAGITNVPTGWRISDYQPYLSALRDIQKLNREYSENMLKLAIDEYSTGIDILEDMENAVMQFQRDARRQKHLSERWYWQEIDRKNQEQRQIARMKVEAKIKAVTYFTRAINNLDHIQSVEIRQHPDFIEFKSQLYRAYVSCQYDLNNFKPCIVILERYLTLSEENRQDVWAYKYLASAYAYMESVLSRYKGNEGEIARYRNKKNQSLLQAVEIEHGLDSPHYKQVQQMVEKDERKTGLINFFN